MTNIIPFIFENTPIRVAAIDGELWFVGKDVAEVLGYSNPQKAIRDHCKACRPVGVNESFTPLLDPQTLLIPERDLYRLVMRSALPGAERFEEWVVGEVLPTLRRTGRYETAAISVVPSPWDFRRQVLWPTLRANLSDRQFRRLPLMRISHLTGLTVTAIEWSLHDLVRDGMVECRDAPPDDEPDVPSFEDLEATISRLGDHSPTEEIERLVKLIALARLDALDTRRLLLAVKAATRMPLTVLDAQFRSAGRRAKIGRFDPRTFRLTGNGSPPNAAESRVLEHGRQP